MSNAAIFGKYSRRFYGISRAAVVVSGIGIAGSALAAPILADFTVSGSAALGFASNSVTLSAPGTVSLPPPNDFGTATLNATVGSIPSTSVQIDSHPFGLTAGGGGSVVLTYHMMYYNAAAEPGSTISATINISNVVTHSGSANARTTFTIPGVYSGYECSSSSGPFSNCGGSNPLHDGAPFASGAITLTQNLDYLLRLAVEAAGPDGQAYAFIDPWFSAPLSGGGEFVFSPGITAFNASATPLPAALPVFATGLGVMGLLGWRRKQTVDCGQAAADL